MTPGRLVVAAAIGLVACALNTVPWDRPLAGRLTLTDPDFADGSRFREFLIAARRGDTVTALLSSDDFDAYLVLATYGGVTLAENDDGGGDCNARLTHVFDYRGLARLYATSASGGELGAFRLEVTRGIPPPPPRDTLCRGFGPVAGTLMLGEAVSGRLDPDDETFGDSTYFERWTLAVPPGATFTVEVESDEFDPYVLLVRGRGEELAADDDSGPGCAARLTYAAPDPSGLRLLVNSTDTPPGQTGTYRLRVLAGARPPDTTRDCFSGGS